MLCIILVVRFLSQALPGQDGAFWLLDGPEALGSGHMRFALQKPHQSTVCTICTKYIKHPFGAGFSEAFPTWEGSS